MARENRLAAVESLAPPSHAGRLHLTESASRRANTRGGATAVRKNVAATTIAPPATYRCVGSSRMKAPPPTWAKATAGQAAATAVETIRIRATRGRVAGRRVMPPPRPVGWAR